jgi:hypothetical protein
MSTGFHPLSIPLPPLQRVGLFAAASVRALAEFAALNAAARECVTQMAVRDRALPGALRADIARGADRAAIKCAWECEALADALVPAARQLGIAAAQVELLIAFREVDDLSVVWSLATPLAQWYGVALNEARPTLFELDLDQGELTGNVDLTRLPSTLERLFVNVNQLSGGLELSQLPSKLVTLAMNHNNFTGAVDLRNLPPSLSELALNENQLSGNVNLQHLSPGLRVLLLSQNALTGHVDLTRLPTTLVRLDLSANQLTGSVDLTQLPATLESLDLETNQLTGPVDLSRLPTTLARLSLYENAGLTGVWRGEKPDGFDFADTGITVVDA